MSEVYGLTQVPVPCICSGTIFKKLDTGTFEVKIQKSPIGEFVAPIHCRLISPSSLQNTYKAGDSVKLMTWFTFTGSEQGFNSVNHQFGSYILGHHEERSLIDIDTAHPITKEQNDRICFTNKKSGSGIAATNEGNLILSTGGVVNTVMRPGGYGSLKDMKQDIAQNYSRIIGDCPPFYLSRETFGLYKGATQEDEAANSTPDSMFINYRRFVTQTKDIDNWVSTCIGTYDPLMGPNNDNAPVSKKKEVLYANIINHGKSRATIEVGDPGDGFITVRVDDIKTDEMKVGEDYASAIAGNRFKLLISDKGAVEIKGGGQGIPGANIDKFNISISADGEMKIYASKKITISHSPADESMNSINLDPDSGIEIKAKKGLTVNGKALVTSDFLDWMVTNSAKFCQVTAVGAPAPIFPDALATLNLKVPMPQSMGGFTTKDVVGVVTGIINDTDSYSS